MKTRLAVVAWLLLQSPSWAGNVTGSVKLSDERDADNIVVYVEHVPGTFAAPKEPIALSQKGARFRPSVLPVLKGTVVDFTNDDWVTHNIFSKSTTKAFDLGLYPKGEKILLPFETLGVVELFCSIHPRMHGEVLVVQNPFFTKPLVDGKFRLTDVPAGTYAVRLHRLGEAEKSVKVVVPAQGDAAVAF